MNGAFIKLLVMGVTAAIPAAGVMILRLLLKKAPRWITCALWILVALRLVLPFSFQSRVSVVPAQSEVSERVVRAIEIERCSGGNSCFVGHAHKLEVVVFGKIVAGDRFVET